MVAAHVLHPHLHPYCPCYYHTHTTTIHTVPIYVTTTYTQPLHTHSLYTHTPNPPSPKPLSQYTQDPLQPLIDKLPPQLREEAAALLAVLLPNSANAKHMSKECSKALEAARQLLVLPPYYAAPRPKMHIDPTITFSIVIAGSVLLLILLVLMLVMPVLSNSLYGPGEQLMEGRGVQPVVIPPEFWTSMLEFHKELQVLRAQNKGG